MLRHATPDDFGFIRALAGRAENRPFITDEDEAGLQVYLDAPDCEIRIWEPDGRPAGYAIFCEIGHPSGRVELMRLALDETGMGRGDRFLQVLLQHAFGTLGGSRVWLDCSAENVRAQKVYARAGFVQEARLRNHDFVPMLGRTIDTLLYGLLRSEWETLEPLAPRA